MKKDLFFMKRALKQAKDAATLGEVPVGAVLTLNDEIIAEDHNRSISLNDPSAHAEINVIRKACLARKDLHLSDCTMYVTLEPCSMCLAAIVNSRIKKLIYGLQSPKYGAFSSNHSTCQNIERVVKKIEVYGGFYQSEISQIMKEFFELRRVRFDGNRY